jgi:hypothetical protein
MSDATHPAPHARKVSRRTLALCVMTAPAFWLAQLVLGFGAWSYGCYPGDHPVRSAVSPAVYTFTLVFDAVALLAAIGAGVLSYSIWRSVHDEKEGGHKHLLSTGEGRTRFIAMWGMLFSLCFFVAIVFATIASTMVPTCG